jgi:RNA-binding protein 25
MERRVRPWINKKIIEYIGEEEPTLVEFVCSKVLIPPWSELIVSI